MEKIVKEGKDIETILNELLNENKLIKEEILWTTKEKKGKLFKGNLIEITAYKKEDINNTIKNFIKEIVENMGLEINLKISLPGKITETNYGNINNNEVKINLLDFITQKQTTEIKITSSKQNFDSRLINILLIIILVTSLYFLLRKKH